MTLGMIDITPSSNYGVNVMPECSIEECKKPAWAKTYCHMHYKRLRVHGSPYETKSQVREECSVEGCVKLRVGHGYCSKHYQRLMKHGDVDFVNGTGKGEAIAFLHEVVIPYGGEECLIWPFSRTAYGYGSIGRAGMSSNLVHRIVCEKVNGSPATPDLEAAHNCGKGHEGCVNPRHLRWDTRQGNQNDKKIHGTTARGEKCGNSRLKESQVREIKSLLKSVIVSDVARFYGLPYGTVFAIHQGKTWGWLD